MNIPKEIIHNWLMGFAFVRDRGKQYHCTGLNRDPVEVKSTFDFYTSHASVRGKRILELGPGQTLDVLAMALKNGAASCSAVDIIQYLSSDEMERMGVGFNLYDGRYLPFGDGQFDVIWASDVFEHLRYPSITVKELHRVLASGGVVITRVDLRDHFHLPQEERWCECRKYGTRVWNAMTWNRSNYVNRLTLSQWQALFKDSGFAVEGLTPHSSDILRARCRELDYLRRYDPEDIRVFCFEAVLHLAS